MYELTYDPEVANPHESIHYIRVGDPCEWVTPFECSHVIWVRPRCYIGPWPIIGFWTQFDHMYSSLLSRAYWFKFWGLCLFSYCSPSYCSCWHGVSLSFSLKSCHDCALDERALQVALPFFTHAILLDRAFVHCLRFPTVVSHRSLSRVSVPSVTDHPTRPTR